MKHHTIKGGVPFVTWVQGLPYVKKCGIGKIEGRVKNPVPGVKIIQQEHSCALVFYDCGTQYFYAHPDNGMSVEEFAVRLKEDLVRSGRTVLEKEESPGGVTTGSRAGAFNVGRILTLTSEDDHRVCSALFQASELNGESGLREVRCGLSTVLKPLGLTDNQISNLSKNEGILKRLPSSVHRRPAYELRPVISTIPGYAVFEIEPEGRDGRTTTNQITTTEAQAVAEKIAARREINKKGRLVIRDMGMATVYRILFHAARRNSETGKREVGELPALLKPFGITPNQLSVLRRNTNILRRIDVGSREARYELLDVEIKVEKFDLFIDVVSQKRKEGFDLGLGPISQPEPAKGVKEPTAAATEASPAKPEKVAVNGGQKSIPTSLAKRALEALGNEVNSQIDQTKADITTLDKEIEEAELALRGKHAKKIVMNETLESKYEELQEITDALGRIDGN